MRGGSLTDGREGRLAQGEPMFGANKDEKRSLRLPTFGVKEEMGVKGSTRNNSRMEQMGIGTGRDGRRTDDSWSRRGWMRCRRF
jgi:hypothetical protein